MARKTRAGMWQASRTRDGVFYNLGCRFLTKEEAEKVEEAFDAVNPIQHTFGGALRKCVRRGKKFYHLGQFDTPEQSMEMQRLFDEFFPRKRRGKNDGSQLDPQVFAMWRKETQERVKAAFPSKS